MNMETALSAFGVPASFWMCEGAAVDHQLAFEPVAFGAEQLKILQL